jgi:hypothetical protein
MVSPTDDDVPDDITPMPLDELLERSEMPPPPEIVLPPLLLSSIWDSDMMTKFLDDTTCRKK